MPLLHDIASRGLTDAYTEIDRVLGSVAETDLMRPSGCGGWVVGDVLFHLLTGAQDVLVALSGSTKDAATADHVSYWRNHAIARSPEDDLQQARYVRIGASAYPRPSALVSHWQRTTEAVLKVVEYAPGDRRVPFEGGVVTVTDLFAVFAVEATIHHLDLVAGLPGLPGPRAGALELAARVLDELLGGIDRPDWDDMTFVGKATGRSSLTVSEQRLFDGYHVSLPLIA